MKRITFLVAIMLLVAFYSCQKEISHPNQQPEDLVNAANANSEHGHLKQTKEVSSDGVFKWIDIQLQMMRTSSPFIGGLPVSRVYGYTGVALYEAVVPGMPSYQSLSGQLSGMPSMPNTMPGYAYHWGVVANATMAAMSRNFFPITSDANKAAMKKLEDSLNAIYQNEISDAATFKRSVDRGQQVAQLIFAWAETDGYKNAQGNYTPLGAGYWAPTLPAFLAAFGPHWGENRLMVAGSLDGGAQPAPPSYSTDPSSAYYQTVKEVYDISQTLTPEQTAIGLFYRDNPGFGGGHYLSQFKQVLQQEQPGLDFTAFAYAKTGIAIVDAGIGCWKTKYTYNQERPIKYIREVLGHSGWNPLFNTPNFPDFPSGHSTLAGTFAEIMEGLFGYSYEFTDHSYDYLGMAPRTYHSFDGLAKEIGAARVYAGIHYTYSCTAAVLQGRTIAKNVNRSLKFLKE